MKKYVLTVLLSLLVNNAWADNYSIMMDAGSTGTRLHLFQYDARKPVPVIEDVFSVKVKKPLASYANHPQDAGDSLKEPLDQITSMLQQKVIKPETVTVSVMATAGMRLLPEKQQQAIYENVTQFIKQNYAYKIEFIGTISGKQEGLYGWLDVNYLMRNFYLDKKTVGTIDMGGASTQIAFETNDLSKPDDMVYFRINNKDYKLFSKSFLGLGQDQARMQLMTQETYNACYPTGYKPTGTFNSFACGTLYSGLIDKYKVATEILPVDKNQKMVAFSGAYYAYQFLNLLDTTDQAAVEKRIENYCTQSWDIIKPQAPEEFASIYCANAIYMDKLFYGTYQVGKQFAVMNKINETELDWTLGAMLYQIIKIQ